MIKRELAAFLVVGLLTVLVDFSTYTCLGLAGIFGVNASKGVGFLTGTVFAYFSNRIWTFGHRAPARGSAWRFAILYMATLISNVWVNDSVIKILGPMSHINVIHVAFITATGISATLNFLGMRCFVFKLKAAC